MVLLIVSLIVHVVRVTWAYRRNNRRATSPEYAVATVASNPCYEASMNLTEAQEAMHIYEVVKPLQAT